MKINLIWAQANHRVIGLNGKMPWHLPEDLAHFKRMTLGAPVIMGRKTWDSLPDIFRPLPGRTNLVVSASAFTRDTLHQAGATPSPNLQHALTLCEQAGAPAVWIIGGAQMYALALPLAHELVITKIDADFVGDAFAPEVEAAWRLGHSESHVSANGLPYSVNTYFKS